MNKAGFWVSIASCCLLITGCTEQVPPENTAAEKEVPQTNGSFFVVDKYDPSRDAVKDLVTTTELAGKTGKRILIEVGGKW